MSTHPDYSACTFPPGGGDRCVCGGVRHWHAAPPYGCDDCKECTAFDAAPLGPTETQVRAQVAAEIRARIVAEPLLMYVTDWRDGMETAAEIAGGMP